MNLISSIYYCRVSNWSIKELRSIDNIPYGFKLIIEENKIILAGRISLEKVPFTIEVKRSVAYTNRLSIYSYTINKVLFLERATIDLSNRNIGKLFDKYQKHVLKAFIRELPKSIKICEALDLDLDLTKIETRYGFINETNLVKHIWFEKRIGFELRLNNKISIDISDIDVIENRLNDTYKNIKVTKVNSNTLIVSKDFNNIDDLVKKTPIINDNYYKVVITSTIAYPSGKTVIDFLV